MSWKEKKDKFDKNMFNAFEILCFCETRDPKWLFGPIRFVLLGIVMVYLKINDWCNGE